MKIIEKLKMGVWNVGIIEKSAESILQGEEYSIRWVKHRYKDRFFADPFLWKMDEKNYFILAEEYKFIDRKGRIVLLQVDKNSFKLIRKKVIIDEQTHLSYPIVYKGEIIPESYKSGTLSAYRVSDNKLIKSCVYKGQLIDGTFLDYDGKEWIFATTKEEELDAQSKLSIFYKKDGRYIPISSNPVKNDIKTARPGGNFFELNGVLYRPAQNCEHFYGESIKIMQVDKLSVCEYKEHEILEISDPSREYKGMHTFNDYKNFVIVDGYKDIYSWQKVLYVKFKWLYKILNPEINTEGYHICQERGVVNGVEKTN